MKFIHFSILITPINTRFISVKNSCQWLQTNAGWRNELIQETR